MTTKRALTLLNQSGDTTIIWDESNDDAMEAIIEKKMAEGVTFFVISPRFGGIASPIKSRLADASEARRHRALAIPDEDFAAFVANGAGEAVETPKEPVKKSRISRNPKEVAKSQSVGVKQLRGG